MRKILVLSVMALLGMMPAVGQHFFLKLEGGITSLYNADVRRLGTFGVGAGYEYEFDQKWSVSPAIMYVAKGWKEKTAIVPARDDDGNFVYDSETGEQVFGKKGVKSYANYIQVPVLFNYYIRLESPHYVSLSAGPYAAYGIAGKTETYGDTDRQGAERVYYEQNTFGDLGAHRFDMGLVFSVGYEYNRYINLSVNTDWGLMRVRPGGGKNRSFYLSFLYRL